MTCLLTAGLLLNASGFVSADEIIPDDAPDSDASVITIPE